MENFKPDINDLTKVWTGFSLENRQVVCAANRYGDEIILGVRHFCPLMRKHLDQLNLKGSEPHEQGFVDQWGNFMDRSEALLVLKSNGRYIRSEEFIDELYSENIY